MAVLPVERLTSRVNVARITARARAIRPGRTLLTVVAAVLYALGWLVAKAFGVAWLALAWAAAAVQVGWEDARRRPAAGQPTGPAGDA